MSKILSVLILEDDENRQARFKQTLAGCKISIVETATDAILQLTLNDWDYLFLDHDLGGQQMVESGPGTGYEVAKWLEENPDHKPANIVIHSFNPVGARKMHRALPGSLLHPGCWDVGFQ